MKQYTLKKLIMFEKENNLWGLSYLDYPIWIYFREDISKASISIKKYLYIPTVKTILKSGYHTIMFLLMQKKYKKVYFLANRVELLEVYKQDKEKDKILFLFNETDIDLDNLDYIDASFLNVIRYLFRKVTYIFSPLSYIKFSRKMLSIGYDKSRFNKIKIAMGDAAFLKILSFILNSKLKYIYSGAVIPAGERFLNRLNSYEVQHGVIHVNHVGYIGIPEVKNTFIVYSKEDQSLLEREGYKGRIIVDEYKKSFLSEQTDRCFFIVIYTQPIPRLRESIEKFCKSKNPKDICIQKHPRDHYHYDLDEDFFVRDTRPSEVKFPICYSSTIIENFMYIEKDCFIYDIKDSNIELEDVLNVYKKDNNAQMLRYDNLEDIYNHLMLKKKY